MNTRPRVPAAAIALALCLPLMAHAAPYNKSTPDVRIWGPRKEARREARASRVDVNAASRQQLDALPGIDRAGADRIVAHRPYARLSQLVSKKVLSASEYQRVREHLTVGERMAPHDMRSERLTRHERAVRARAPMAKR